MCNLVKKMPFSRDKKYKWYISEAEYNRDYFDRYCSGAAYILTVDLVPKMFDYALHIKHVWIDDFFLTGLLGKLANVDYVDLKNAFLLYETSVEKKLRMYSKSNTYYLFGHLPAGLPWGRSVPELDDHWNKLPVQPTSCLLFSYKRRSAPRS